MFPSVLLIANIRAAGSSTLVIPMMFAWPSGVMLGKRVGTMSPMNIKAMTASMLIRMLAPVRTVFPTLYASSLFLIK